jgi:competence protein ComEC
VGGVLLAGAYALFSGWGVPAQRTVLMLACMTALRISGLRWPWWLTWLWAGAAVLALDPWAMLQAGFWLSFVAVGILFATDSRAAGAGDKRASGHFVQLLREQGVVTLALTPLSLMLFGQASVVACWPTCWPFRGSRWWSRRWRWRACCGRRCGRWPRGSCSPCRRC